MVLQLGRSFAAPDALILEVIHQNTTNQEDDFDAVKAVMLARTLKAILDETTWAAFSDEVTSIAFE
jgi:hypothetical protein